MKVSYLYQCYQLTALWGENFAADTQHSAGLQQS